ELCGAVDEAEPFERVVVRVVAPRSSRGLVIGGVELRVKAVALGILVNKVVPEFVASVVLVGEAEQPEHLTDSIEPDDAPAATVMPSPGVGARAALEAVRQRRCGVLLLQEAS